MRRVAVLTSGGGSPGMSAATRAVVRTGVSRGFEMLDNDLVGTDVSIGATTALDTALEAIDRLRVRRPRTNAHSWSK